MKIKEGKKNNSKSKKKILPTEEVEKKEGLKQMERLEP